MDAIIVIGLTISVVGNHKTPSFLVHSSVTLTEQVLLSHLHAHVRRRLCKLDQQQQAACLLSINYHAWERAIDRESICNQSSAAACNARAKALSFALAKAKELRQQQQHAACLHSINRHAWERLFEREQGFDCSWYTYIQIKCKGKECANAREQKEAGQLICKPAHLKIT